MAVIPLRASAGNQTAKAVFAGLPRRYDRLAWLLSFGQDRRWRGRVVDAVAAAAPARVLDVATGPAGVALAVARRTGAAVVGVDIDEAMLREGVRNVHRDGRADSVSLMVARAEDLPFEDGSFDAVTFAYLLRYVDEPDATLAELARCVRPGGVLAGLDFYVPPRLLWRWLWRLYTAVVLPTIGGLLGGRAWWRVGRFLGPNIRGHYERFPLEWHVDAWKRAGLRDVDWRIMSVGGGIVMWGTKEPSS